MPLRSPAFISFCKIADINVEAGERMREGLSKKKLEMTETGLEYGMCF